VSFAIIGIVLLLFVVLLVFTFMISPPSAWVKSDRDKLRNQDPPKR
jgi:hypothetical protein